MDKDFYGAVAMNPAASDRNHDLSLPLAARSRNPAMLSRGVYHLRDAAHDERALGHSFVNDLGIRFYAAAPLRTNDGFALGTVGSWTKHKQLKAQETRDWVAEPDRRARIFHPEDIERVREERRRGFSSGIPFQKEQGVRRHDGKYRWFLIHFRPVREPACIRAAAIKDDARHHSPRQHLASRLGVLRMHPTLLRTRDLWLLSGMVPMRLVRHEAQNHPLGVVSGRRRNPAPRF